MSRSLPLLLGLWLGLLPEAIALPSLAVAQPVPLTIPAAELVQDYNFADKVLEPKDTIEIILSEEAQEQFPGPYTLVIGSTDISDLLQVEGNQIRYQPSFLPLPTGQTTVTLYRFDTSTGWQTLVQLPLRVQLSGSGLDELNVEELTSETFDPPTSGLGDTSLESPSLEEVNNFEPELKTSSSFLIQPSINLSLTSQLQETVEGDAQASERPTFTDLTAETTWEIQARQGNWELDSRFSFLGVSFQEQALRFGELAEAAPQFDLSDYQIENRLGPVSLSLGHLCTGNHPLLVDNFCSRGLSAGVEWGDRANLSFSQLRSTSVVGFDDFTGLNDLGNTLSLGTLDVQLAENQFDGVRLSLNYLKGSRKALESFNVGEVVDAEKSEGFGVRLFGSDNDGHLRFDAAFARSRFTNPSSDAELLDFESEFDPELGDAVAVEPVTEDAYFLDTSYDLVRSLPLGGDRSFSLSLNARHERIAAQYASLGAAVSSGQLQSLVGVRGELADIAFDFQQSWLEDNLDNIPTVLKTKTRSSLLNLEIPLKQMLQSESFWIPDLSYSFQRTRQFGANFPSPNLSGFDETEIPDQVSLDHQLQVNWLSDDWTLGYQLSHSFQDNRQPSREQADFRTINHQIDVGWQPSENFQLNLGYSLSQAEDIEAGITQFTIGPTAGLTWQLLNNVTLSLNYNRTTNYDSLNQAFARNHSFESTINWQFDQIANTGLSGNFFIRFSQESNLIRDNLFEFESDSLRYTINTGLNLSF